jgi:hypothetical protein
MTLNKTAMKQAITPISNAKPRSTKLKEVMLGKLYIPRYDVCKSEVNTINTITNITLGLARLTSVIEDAISDMVMQKLS